MLPSIKLRYLQKSLISWPNSLFVTHLLFIYYFHSHNQLLLMDISSQLYVKKIITWTLKGLLNFHSLQNYLNISMILSISMYISKSMYIFTIQDRAPLSYLQIWWEIQWVCWTQTELFTIIIWASLVAQLVKKLPAMQETPVQFLGWKDSPGEGIGYPLQYSWASLVAQTVKKLPATWETWVWYQVGNIPWGRE